MVDEQKSRMDVIEQGAENIRQSNLLSDTFASIALQDKGACQYVIRTILGIDDLKAKTTRIGGALYFSERRWYFCVHDQN